MSPAPTRMGSGRSSVGDGEVVGTPDAGAEVAVGTGSDPEGLSDGDGPMEGEAAAEAGEGDGEPKPVDEPPAAGDDGAVATNADAELPAWSLGPGPDRPTVEAS